jgi:hypothetical protein
MGSTIATMIGSTSSLFVLVVIVIAMALIQQQHSMPSIEAYKGPASSNITSNITSTSCIDNQPCVTTICINNNPCHTFKSNSNSTANTNTTNDNSNNINPPPADSNKLDQQSV